MKLSHVQREKAIQVLRDIVAICSDYSAIISSVSLNPPAKDNGLIGYQLKVGTVLNGSCRSGLMPLLKQRNLEIEERDGFITIFKRQ